MGSMCTKPAPTRTSNQVSDHQLASGACVASSPAAGDKSELVLNNDDVRRLIEEESRLVVLIYGKVYDLTDFAPRHPGGESVLRQYMGKDAGDTFVRIHSLSTKSRMQRYCIGSLR
uniref:Putative nitrate reductase n=1 Tax=Trypanosoma congolense (strain IL3000) TaxID=1068625 RepID=G0UNH5_TRYCI|nr:putative nitrate reductase [Trypanosoma congolense IL3000]